MISTTDIRTGLGEIDGRCLTHILDQDGCWGDYHGDDRGGDGSFTRFNFKQQLDLIVMCFEACGEPLVLKNLARLPFTEGGGFAWVGWVCEVLPAVADWRVSGFPKEMTIVVDETYQSSA